MGLKRSVFAGWVENNVIEGEGETRANVNPTRRNRELFSRSWIKTKRTTRENKRSSEINKEKGVN